MDNMIFQRTELLVGSDSIERLAGTRIILFGVGGVGSWCAEGLVRSGVGHLTIVDPDNVCMTNINRQLPALHSTLGQSKVEVLKKRLLDINPMARIEAIQSVYNAETAEDFGIDRYDIIIDAIDSLADKMLLILNATSVGGRFYSSMGAALKIDPQRIRVGEFWKVKGCPLAAALRQRFRRSGSFPSKKFKCVFSEELVKNKKLPNDVSDGSMTYNKVSVNGTFPTTVAIFGLTLANIVVRDVINVT